MLRCTLIGQTVVVATAGRVREARGTEAEEFFLRAQFIFPLEDSLSTENERSRIMATKKNKPSAEAQELEALRTEKAAAEKAEQERQKVLAQRLAERNQERDEAAAKAVDKLREFSIEYDKEIAPKVREFITRTKVVDMDGSPTPFQIMLHGIQGGPTHRVNVCLWQHWSDTPTADGQLTKAWIGEHLAKIDKVKFLANDYGLDAFLETRLVDMDGKPVLGWIFDYCANAGGAASIKKIYQEHKETLKLNGGRSVALSSKVLKRYAKTAKVTLKQKRGTVKALLSDEFVSDMRDLMRSEVDGYFSPGLSTLQEYVRLYSSSSAYFSNQQKAARSFAKLGFSKTAEGKVTLDNARSCAIDAEFYPE